MNYKKIKFKNSEGLDLSGYLELPLNRHPHSYVLFAHCFTCNKNFFAVKNIARALSAKGYGVLRFDFSGLGESDGEFANTTFSGNVEDLLAAADFLKQEYKAPEMLIGHSLGGAAVIFAAEKLSSVKSVVTIGAPSSPVHVKNLLKSSLEEIEEKGVAQVNVGGRNFTIKKKFLEDINTHDLTSFARDLKKAFLIMHSPQDSVVEISNAEALYKSVKHPKSFVSLDGADHLLTNNEDSEYAGSVIASWASRYLEIPEEKDLATKHQVVANLGEEGFTTQMRAGKHYFTADEPKSFGGEDFGPSPYELLSAGLAACTSMTIQMYARRKKWPLLNVETHVDHQKSHAEDCENCERNTAKIDVFAREIVLEGNLDEQQQQKLLEIADKCPVHRTLSNKVKITTQLKKI
ncbi:bifunctional alpha/beta hydrolase/OsmC family protein [Salinimicrobium sediminilitoris]|uniref:bifunctional alpha/beta hydrolase/OsmC family protein n=1 Tax=Salinimicrobium sediminilitoris TaxID=2876715 RepID=UPI001E5854E3|nr:bifunctional alpha/beta hydrolase/OsmC family protein [Salinimicrobium sediminilitoris]MCC8359222.1 bifunctional alpha/beta hydrolase/OsmC family protein [Salinimicrobium sediminilitoris]